MAGRTIKRVAGVTAVAFMVPPSVAHGSTINSDPDFGGAARMMVSEGPSPEANGITIAQSGGVTTVTDTAGVQPIGTAGSCASVAPTVVTCTGVYKSVEFPPVLSMTVSRSL